MAGGKRWGKLHEAIILDLALSARDLRVYGALSIHADKHGRCYVKRKTIAAMTGIHTTNVSKATNHLMERGHLAKVGNGGRSRPAHYLLTAYRNSVTDDTVLEPETVSDGTSFQTPAPARESVTSDTRKEQSIKAATAEDFPPEQGKEKAAAAALSLSDVMSTYNRVLHDLPKVKIPTREMEDDFADLVQKYPKAASPDWWGKYFECVRQSEHLMGMTTGFVANLGWLLRYDNMANTINGKYLYGHGRPKQSHAWGDHTLEDFSNPPGAI